MSDLEALYLILAAIYLIQCIIWVPEDSICFRRKLGGAWRVSTGWLHIGAWGLRGVLAGPLPPLDGLVVCDRVPFAVSPLGVLPSPRTSLRSAGGAIATANFLNFAEMEKVHTRGKEVFSGSKPLFKVPTAGMAQHAAEMLEKLRGNKEAKRAAAIEAEFARTLDSEAIRVRLDDWRGRTALLRWHCNVLFVYLFVLVPFVIMIRGLEATWIWLLGLLLAQMAVISWLFRRAHRALFPEDKEARWTATLTILLSPPVAIRANDIVLRDLGSLFHPLAVAQVLCSEKFFLAMASRTLRELRFPLPSAILPGTPEHVAEAWDREARYRAVERFVAATGAQPQELLAPPAREPQCLSYCPRCWNQYRFAEGTCPDCGGIEVQRFEDAPTPPTP
ncbi:MAG: hypothetical protein M1453_07530 [Acidobacteria bacterium]|nr:hypothetical protein [Acidobacteriota bacterium]